jgi:hypothetical protein
MPRSRCHFALLGKLHDVLCDQLPDIAELVDREAPSFYAGGIAPDALRYFSDLGKFGTHFYSESRRETWGGAISGLFNSHPDLSDPGGLSEDSLALLIGYISHLTVDEAFRDEVTIHVHGTDNWRPIINGLWSIVDEIPVEQVGLVKALAGYTGLTDVGFITGSVVREFSELVGPWAETEDAWEAEKVFLKLVGDRSPEDEAREVWVRNRAQAAVFIDQERTARFIDTALRVGLEEVTAFVNGGYCKMPCT